jgi:hypothetical protein
MPDQKPLIVLIDPIDDDRRDSRKNLEAYFAASGKKVDIREVSSNRPRGSVLLEAERTLRELAEAGEKPALIITDHVLMSNPGLYAGAILRPLRNGEFFQDQDKKWPEGRSVPVVVASGAHIGTEQGPTGANDPGLERYAPILRVTNVCLGSTLNEPMVTSEGGRIQISRFKSFMDEAFAKSLQSQQGTTHKQPHMRGR